MLNIRKCQFGFFICVLFAIVLFLVGCRSAEEDAATTPPSGSESSIPPASSEPTPESTTSSSSSADSSVSTSTSSTSPQSSTSSDAPIEITPNSSQSAGEAPKPDGPPDVNVSTPSQKSESGKITLSLDDAQEITVSDDAVIATILAYVGSMKESSYNAENTPPAMGGRNITVAVHKDNGVEQYIFTEVTAEGNTLGKDLQGDTFMWKITDSNAMPYLLSFFS